jgi:hypothetical protein
VILAIALAVATIAHAETREEMKARFENVRKECAAQTVRELADYNPYFLVREKCRRIDSLHDDLIRCATERHHLRRAAACPHQWHGIGPKVKGCAKCESIAHFVNGEWLVVLADGIWVGPEPIDYPENYGLK